MTPKVLVIGAGAIGGFYGSLLAKAKAEVAVVCRSDYAQVKKHGINISSETLGNWHFRPSRVLQHASEYEGVADFVLLCTKVIPELDRVTLIRPAVKPQTSIVFIQNGVGIENELLDAFPNNDIISGLAFIGCNRIGPGEIKHLAYGRLSLGTISSHPGTKTAALCELFNKSGIECSASDDIIRDRWRKCVWNAAFNPLSVLSGGLLTLDILHSQEPLVRNIMQEISIIAAAIGHTLPTDSIDMSISSTYGMPSYKTSMLLDFENGHPMETEAILGNALRAANGAGIASPHIETVYALMKLRDIKSGTALANSKHE
ncbi:MAG: 2-dehydropantoate 2-reductase [Methylococcaceae bacterium]|nr:2-dehydropantoate 2-reductase [Methylococcaceae bacterium]